MTLQKIPDLEDAAHERRKSRLMSVHIFDTRGGISPNLLESSLREALYQVTVP